MVFRGQPSTPTVESSILERLPGRVGGYVSYLRAFDGLFGGAV